MKKDDVGHCRDRSGKIFSFVSGVFSTEKSRFSDMVEGRILRLQEKKRLVFESTVGRSNEALAKLTEADMKFLFT